MAWSSRPVALSARRRAMSRVYSAKSAVRWSGGWMVSAE